MWDVEAESLVYSLLCLFLVCLSVCCVPFFVTFHILFRFIHLLVLSFISLSLISLVLSVLYSVPVPSLLWHLRKITKSDY